MCGWDDNSQTKKVYHIRNNWFSVTHFRITLIFLLIPNIKFWSLPVLQIAQSNSYYPWLPFQFQLENLLLLHVANDFLFNWWDFSQQNRLIDYVNQTGRYYVMLLPSTQSGRHPLESLWKFAWNLIFPSKMRQWELLWFSKSN